MASPRLAVRNTLIMKRREVNPKRIYHRSDEYLSVKIFTVHETLEKPSIEFEAIQFATRHAYINLYQVFTETSHHGNHLCLVLDVAGSSLEDLRLTSPTKSLSRHIVQRTVACIVLELEKIHKFGFIHGG